PDAAAILHFFPDHRAEDDLAIRLPAHERHLPIDLFGQQVVVGIEVLQPLSARQLEQAVAGGVAAAVSTGLPADAAVETPDDIQTVVARSVIQNDDFLLGPGLRQRTFDRLTEQALGVVDRDQNGNERAHVRAGMAAAGSDRRWKSEPIRW